MIRSLLLQILIVAVIPLYATVPRIVNYNSDHFKTHPLVLSMNEDTARGVMYFSNAYRLLQFTGDQWNSVYNAESASCDHNSSGDIFIGSENDFGVLKSDLPGSLLFTSLAKSIPATGKTQVFKQTLCVGKNTYFLSHDLVVFYNGTESRYFRCDKEENFLFIAVVNSSVLVFTSKGRVGKLSVSGIDFSMMPFGIIVNQVLSVGEKYLLLGSNNLFWWNVRNEIQKINTGSIDLSQVNCISILQNGDIALGTQKNGIILFDPNSGLFEIVDKSKGIASNIIHYLHTDRFGDLWAATDNGVSLLKYGSPYTYINDNQGVEGMGYASIVFDNKVYLGSASGLYFYSSKTLNSNPQKISGVNGYVHDLVNVNGHLLCANEYGAFVIKNNSALKFTTGVGKVWSIRQIPREKNKFLMGTIDNLSLWEINENGDCKSLGVVWGFSESCRKFEIQNNVVWMIHGNKGLFKIQLDKDFKTAMKWENYNVQHHLEGNYFKDIIEINGALFVAGYGGVFGINSDMEMVKSALFSKIPYAFHRLRKINEHELFIKVGQKPVIISLVNGYYQEKYNLLDMDYNVAGSAENITKINERNYLVGVEQGFTLFTPRQKGNELPKVFIREIRISNKTKDSLLSVNSVPFKIDYDFNTLKIDYNLPVFGNKEAVVYFLVLKKSGEIIAIDSTINTVKEYSNLKEGDYTIEISSMMNNKKSLATSFVFSILPPWYRSAMAYLIYALFVLLVVYWVVKQFNKAEQVRVQLTHEKEIAIEDQKVHYEEELAQAETQRKEDEMAFLALNYAQKKQMLNTVTESIQKLMSTMTDENDKRELKNLMLTINMDMEESDENKWEKFQVHLDNTQDNFFKKLKEKDSDLDESGLLMCSYIKMGKSNKEISNLLNISVAAVAKRKYRMKKKWNLEEDDSLTEFLKTL